MYPPDLHVHSSLSGCAKREFGVEAVVDAALSNGLSTIGLTNHLWRPEDFDELFDIALSAREVGRKRGLNVLLSAEVEVFGADAEPSILPEQAARLDYVLFASGHLHLAHVRKPEKRTKAALIDYLHEMHLNICRHPLASAIAHPWQMGSRTNEGQGFPPTTADDMPADLLEEFGRLARETQTAIELNCGVLRPQDDGLPACADRLLRVLEFTAPQGPDFMLGSDAHDATALNRIPLMNELMPHIGLSADRLVVPRRIVLSESRDR